MNRETKRLLQRQGQLGPDGEPIAADRDERVSAAAAGRRVDAAKATKQRDATGKIEKDPLPQRFVQFMREVRSELSKVAWPSRSEVVTYTIVVFFAVTVLTAIVYGLDYGFLTVVNFLFKSK